MRHEEYSGQMGKGLGIKKGADLGQLFKEKVRKTLPWVICLLHNKGILPGWQELAASPRSLHEVSHISLLCFIAFMLPQKISLHLVVALKNMLGFLLKNKTPIKG